MNARQLHARISAGEATELLGLRLVPFTIGHARLLDLYECRALGGPDEIALAVLICSRPQERVPAFLRSSLLPLRLAIWRLYLVAWDALQARATLIAYFRRHTELPMYAFRGEPGTTPIPDHQMIRVRLLRLGGYRPRDIDGTPYLQAIWDLRTADVLEGKVEMYDMSEADVAAAEAGIDWGRVLAAGEKVLSGAA